MAEIFGFPFGVPGFLVALFVLTGFHELGHFLVAKLLRVPVKLIAVGVGPTLWEHALTEELRLKVRAAPVGMSVGVLGRRNPDGTLRRPVRHDIAMAAGGPLASLLLTVLLVLVALLASSHPVLQAWYLGTAALSLVLTVLNLLPLPGLDGGHLALLIASRFGLDLSARGEAKAHRIGLQLAALLCVVVFLVQLVGAIG